MQIDLKYLLSKDSVLVDENVSIPEEYLNDSEINSLKDLRASGKIYYSISEELILDLELVGKMILNDAYTLELVEYPFNIDIDEVLTVDFVKNGQKGQNILDITDILWQNIVLEIPISYSLTSEVNDEKGNGWELVKDQKKKIDPRLAVLNELLEKGKE